MAIVTPYLLTSFFAVHPPRDLGVRTERELRTLAMAMGCALRGNTAGCLDVLGQRSKAIERAVVDGHWDTARWMELIPTGESVLVPRQETLHAQPSVATR